MPEFRSDAEFLAHMHKYYPKSENWQTVEDVASSVQLMTGLVETHLYWRFAEIFGWEPEKHNTDFYDRSAEIHGMPEGFVVTDGMRKAMGDLGFQRFWLHIDHEHRRMPGEQYHVTIQEIKTG